MHSEYCSRPEYDLSYLFNTIYYLFFTVAHFNKVICLFNEMPHVKKTRDAKDSFYWKS